MIDPSHMEGLALDYLASGLDPFTEEVNQHSEAYRGMSIGFGDVTALHELILRHVILELKSCLKLLLESLEKNGIYILSSLLVVVEAN